MKPDIGRSETRSWKRVLGGLLSACLLIPVPVFAIDFSNVQWNLVPPNNQGQVTNAAFFTLGTGISQSNTTGSSVLTFTFPAQFNLGGKTVVQTTAGHGITVGPGQTLNASWGGLSALNNPSQGNISVGIASFDGTTTNNMFSPSGPLSPPYTFSPAIGSISTPGTYQITVTFDYSGGVAYSSASTFTLTFTGSP
jgi:hypothetical protein